MVTNILSSFATIWERIMTPKILGSFVIIFAIYTLATFFISIQKLNSSPDQLFLSEPVKPEIIELASANLDNLNKEIGKIKSIVVFTKENKAIYLVQNAGNYQMEPAQLGMGEMILQYASGSNLAFATNCPNMTKYKHGTCTGPTYDSNGNIVSPRICECVLR